MKLIDLQTNGQIIAGLELVTPREQKQLGRNAEFEFDWHLLKDDEIYKLYRLDTGEILGLMALKNDPASRAVEIKLLETGKSNVGGTKKIDRIAGCLIASACRFSFLRGFDGWIKLIAKTELIEHYKRKYYMKQIGSRQTCCIEQAEAQKLIDEYLSH